MFPRVAKRPDPLSYLFAGLFLLVVGLLLLMAQLGRMSWNDLPAYLSLGLGGVFLLDALVRRSFPRFRTRIIVHSGTGYILLNVGLALFLGADRFWPLLLVLLGALALVHAALRLKVKKRES